MPWLKIDDVFEEHEKVKRLSDAAHRLWMRAACWSQKTGSKGYVPREMLESIAQKSAPVRRLEALANELVMARAGGVYAAGLWEVTEGGWVFHDWADYQPDPVAPKMTRAEAASAAGKASAKARVELYGTAQPVRHERTSNNPSTFEQRSTNNVRRTEAEPTEPPDPDPDPRSDLIQISSQRPESSTRARPVGSVVGSKVPEIAMENRCVTNPDVLPVTGHKPAKSDGEPARHRTRLSDLENDFPTLCRALETNPHNASFYPVQTRPEVLELHSAWCEATGLSPRRLGAFQRDPGVRAICALYALDYSRADLLSLVQCAAKDKWIMGLEDGPNGRPKDIAVLSPTKAGALLDLARVRERKTAKAKARRDAELEQARREQKEDTDRRRAPRPAPVDIETLFATVPSTGFTLSLPRRPRPTAPPVPHRPLTAEEIDRALEKEHTANA
jgi:hypothetical protein